MNNTESSQDDAQIIINSVSEIKIIESNFEDGTKHLISSIEIQQAEITPYHFDNESGFFKNHFFDAINAVEKEIIREKNFSTEINAKLFFQKAKDFLSLLKHRQQEANESFQIINKYQEKSSIVYGNFVPLILLSCFGMLLFGALAFDVGQNLYNNWWRTDGFWNIFKKIAEIPIVFFMGTILSVWASAIVTFPVFITWKKVRSKKIDKKIYDLPPWMKFLDTRINSLLELLDSALQESLDEIRSNKALKFKNYSLEIEDKFNEKISSRSLAERLAIIQKELDAAMATTQNLNEQHRLTEEIRLKYAKELVDIEKQVRNERNQELIDKVALVEELLGGTP